MSGIRSIHRGPVVKGYATAGSAPIRVNDTTNRLSIVPAGTGTTEIVLQEASGAGSILVPTVAFTLTAAQSGLHVFLNAAAGFAITLPAVAVGLRYTFTVAAAFASTNFTIITPALANLIFGAAIVASTEVPADAEDTISFVASAELPGDFVEIWSDGTLWFVNGRGSTSGSITFTTAG